MGGFGAEDGTHRVKYAYTKKIIYERIALLFSTTVHALSLPYIAEALPSKSGGRADAHTEAAGASRVEGGVVPDATIFMLTQATTTIYSIHSTSCLLSLLSAHWKHTKCDTTVGATQMKRTH